MCATPDRGRPRRTAAPVSPYNIIPPEEGDERGRTCPAWRGGARPGVCPTLMYDPASSDVKESVPLRRALRWLGHWHVVTYIRLIVMKKATSVLTDTPEANLTSFLSESGLRP
jgi:hypothetical protein